MECDVVKCHEIELRFFLTNLYLVHFKTCTLVKNIYSFFMTSSSNTSQYVSWQVLYRSDTYDQKILGTLLIQIQMKYYPRYLWSNITNYIILYICHQIFEKHKCAIFLVETVSTDKSNKLVDSDKKQSTWSHKYSKSYQQHCGNTL